MVTALARFAAALLVTSTVVVPAAPARADAPATLTIRLYNTAGLAFQDVAAARQHAERLLHDTGMRVSFRYCGPATPEAPSAAPCDAPLQPFELAVRILPAPAFHASLHPDAFGVTYIVKATNRGWLAAVFPDRIAAAAARAGVDGGALLGRVIAHEIGHLLLGVGYHGDTGLMRAEWPDDRTADGDEWRFSSREAARIQQLLAGRLQQK